MFFICYCPTRGVGILFDTWGEYCVIQVSIFHTQEDCVNPNNNTWMGNSEQTKLSWEIIISISSLLVFQIIFHPERICLRTIDHFGFVGMFLFIFLFIFCCFYLSVVETLLRRESINTKSGPSLFFLFFLRAATNHRLPPRLLPPETIYQLVSVLLH